jgi:hypothetical protein
MKLEYVWFRRDPFKIDRFPGITYKKRKLINVINPLWEKLFIISNGLVAETTGWMGVFKRIS